MVHHFALLLFKVLVAIFKGIRQLVNWMNIVAKLRDIHYTNAVTQLGSDSMTVRLAGIRTLGRIARSSRYYYPQIILLLVAFIHEHASVSTNPVAAAPSSPPCPRKDVQEILYVLRRRRRSYNKGENFRIDLGATDLRGANLQEVKLQGANLRGAKLQNADLRGAYLQDANFDEDSSLADANLRKAHLEGADLRHADLRRARFGDAKLCGTFFGHQPYNLRSTRELTWEQLSEGTIMNGDNLVVWDRGSGNLEMLRDLLPLSVQAPSRS